MGKIGCLCGYIHSDTCGSDGDLCKSDELDNAKTIESINSLSVFECSKCGNIMIDDPRNPRMMISYSPCNGKYNKVLHDREE